MAESAFSRFFLTIGGGGALIFLGGRGGGMFLGELFGTSLEDSRALYDALRGITDPLGIVLGVLGVAGWAFVASGIIAGNQDNHE